MNASTGYKIIGYAELLLAAIAIFLAVTSKMPMGYVLAFVFAVKGAIFLGIAHQRE